jgi:hypothetical protein
MTQPNSIWYKFSDPASKCAAYVNLETLEFSYELPSHINLDKDTKCFLEIVDELTGQSFYLDTEAKAATWKKPSSGIILPAPLVQVYLYFYFLASSLFRQYFVRSVNRTLRQLS